MRLSSEIEDLQAIVDWERESYAVGVSSIEEDEEFTVEVSIQYNLY